MIIYCLKNEYISDAAEYTINYLLNRSGFFFEWINEPEDIETTGLLLVYQPGNHSLDLAIPFIHLTNYFDLSRLTDCGFEWKEIKIENNVVPVIKNLKNQNFSELKPTLSSFDLVANIYYHLARLEESYFTHPDNIDNNVQNSILFKHGKFLVPIVDLLSDYFINEIEKKINEEKLIFIKKKNYPKGQTFGIALTHDVDFIRAYHPLKKRIIKLLVQLGIKKNINLDDINQREKDTWGFDRLLSFYKDNNYKATFFFMAKYLERFHFRYRINSKKIKQLFFQLKSENHEIAFHPSRYAFENPKRYLIEKRKLEKISNIQLSGLRHHYLRCLFPQIWKIAAGIKFKYEAGMIHRGHSGFRAGTCFPFPTFDHSNQKTIDIIEFPTTFFENTLPDKGKNYEISKNTIQQLLSIIKKQGGIFNILWHSSNFFQPDIYKRLWEFITGLIKNENAYLQTLAGHLNWYKFREQIKIKSLKEIESGYVIDIALPEGVQQFCLHTPDNYSFKSESDIQHDAKKNTLILKNSKCESHITIEAHVI